MTPKRKVHLGATFTFNRRSYTAPVCGTTTGVRELAFTTDADAVTCNLCVGAIRAATGCWEWRRNPNYTEA